jgi:hypothetical protein
MEEFEFEETEESEFPNRKRRVVDDIWDPLTEWDDEEDLGI